MAKNERPFGYFDPKTGVRNICVPVPRSVYKVLRDWADARDCSISQVVALLVADELSRDYLSDLEVRNG